MRAAILLGIASIAVALLPFRHAISLGSVALGRRKTIDPADVIWAVNAAARRLPWRTVCIEKGMVAQRMLRTGGIHAVLHYGARQGSEYDPLEAHVWVSVAGQPVIGGEEAVGFAAIAHYS